MKFSFRRVRENPGGNTSMANFWDTETPAVFKPTRRYALPPMCRSVDQVMPFSVRQGPGGHDSISGVSFLAIFLQKPTCA